MHYTYILRSKKDKTKTYIGHTNNINKKLAQHNNNESAYTSKYSPWELEVYVVLKDKKMAVKLEKYLKTGSGKAFINKQLVTS